MRQRPDVDDAVLKAVVRNLVDDPLGSGMLVRVDGDENDRILEFVAMLAEEVDKDLDVLMRVVARQVEELEAIRIWRKRRRRRDMLGIGDRIGRNGVGAMNRAAVDLEILLYTPRAVCVW